MKVIAFGHRRRTGKDQAGTFVAANYRIHNKNKLVKKQGFALKLKEHAYLLYKHHGLKPPEYYDEHPEQREIIIPALGKSPRDIWIELGNAVRQVYGETWIDLLLYGTNCDLLIVTDLRYPNEATKIKNLGGIVIRINREAAPIFNDIADSSLANYNAWDHVIQNNGSLTQFHNDVINATKGYLNGN